MNEAKMNESRPGRVTGVLVAGILALLLSGALFVSLSRDQVLAQPGMEVTELSVQKEVSTDVAAPGETLHYTITIHETAGPAVSLWMTDTLPEEVTYVSGSLDLLGPGSYGIANGVITWTADTLGFGATAYIYFSAEISSALSCATVVNTAQLTGTGTLIERSATTAVAADNNLTVEKSVNPEGQVEPGDTLAYTITIRDELGASGSVWLTDTLPPELGGVSGLGMSLGSAGFDGDVVTWTGDLLGYGYTARVWFNAVVSPSIPADDGVITNSIVVAGQCQRLEGEVVSTYHRRRGVLGMSKTVYPETVPPGNRVTYTLHISNTGDGPVAAASLIDPLPPEVTYEDGSLTATTGTFGEASGTITWTGALASPEEATIAFSAITSFTLPNLLVFSNTAEITGAGSLVSASVGAKTVITREYLLPLALGRWPPHYYLPLALRKYPPVLVLNPIPTPDGNHSFDVSWEEAWFPFDQYALQMSRDEAFSQVVSAWTTNVPSQQVMAYCPYYFRVRVDNAGDWGEGPWSNVEASEASPPTPVLAEIPEPDGNDDYTVSWSPIPSWGEVDRYRLQESTDSGFGSITGEWLTTGTSQFIDKTDPPLEIYYRVRAEDDDCWGQGPWSNIQSVTFRAYYYEFGDSGVTNPVPWIVRRTSLFEGDQWGGVWTKDKGGYMRFYMNDKFDFAIASPMDVAPSPPYVLETRVKVNDPANLVAYGIVFGGNTGSVCPAYRDESGGCWWHYYRLETIWAGSYLKAQFKRIDYHVAEKGKGRGESLTEFLRAGGDPDGWHTWKFVVKTDGIDVYYDGGLWASTRDTRYVNEPTFGIYISANEYKPSIAWFDYYRVYPQ